MASSRGMRAGAARVGLYAQDNRLVRGLNRAAKKLRAFDSVARAIGANLLKASAVVTALFAGLPAAAAGSMLQAVGMGRSIFPERPRDRGRNPTERPELPLSKLAGRWIMVLRAWRAISSRRSETPGIR